MKKLGVAVIGLGIGEQHARSFAALPTCQIRLLYDLDTARAEKLAAEFPACHVASNYNEVLTSDGIDIVSIASFDAAHFQQAADAIRAGKHVFVEKPLCRTDAELHTLANLLNSAGNRLHLASNLVLRAAPIYRWLRGEIINGAFGEIYAIDGEYLYGRLHKLTDGWRRAEAEYSVMLGGGIHMIDLMLWLTGQRPTTVSAFGNRICTKNTPFQYNDFVTGTLTFESGMIGRITANFGCVHRHQHVLRIYGTRQTFFLDDAGPRLHTSRDPSIAATQLSLATLPESKGALIPDFVDAILAGPVTDDRDRQTIFDGVSTAFACERAIHTDATEQVIYA